MERIARLERCRAEIVTVAPVTSVSNDDTVTAESTVTVWPAVSFFVAWLRGHDRGGDGLAAEGELVGRGDCRGSIAEDRIVDIVLTGCWGRFRSPPIER